MCRRQQSPSFRTDLVTFPTPHKAERFHAYTQLGRKNRVFFRCKIIMIFFFFFLTCESPHGGLFGNYRAHEASPEWWNLNTDNTVATTHTLFPLLSPHLPLIFSLPPSGSPNTFSLLLLLLLWTAGIQSLISRISQAQPLLDGR